MLGESSTHARDKVASISLVIDVLKLAASAFRKVTAWRHLMVRPVDERSVVEEDIAGNSESHVLAGRGDTVAACSDPDNFLSHRAAQAPAGLLQRDRRRSWRDRRCLQLAREARPRRRRLRSRQAPALGEQ